GVRSRARTLRWSGTEPAPDKPAQGQHEQPDDDEMAFAAVARVGGGCGQDLPPVVGGDVVPLGQADPDRIFDTLLAVIAGEPVAQAPTLYAHDRVLARIEVAATVEHFHAEGVFLEPARLAGKRMLNHVAQHPFLTRGIREQRAGQDPRQLQADGLLVRFPVLVWRHAALLVHVAPPPRASW